MTNKVICGDCLEVMKDIPDKSIDLVVTDPPYGIGETNEKNLSRGNLAKCTDFGHYDWDNQRISRPYFREIFRVSKNQVIFGGNYYTDFLFPSMCWIVWDKVVEDKFSNDFADCELIWTSFERASKIFRWKWRGMIQHNMRNKEPRFHPTQKPIALMQWLIIHFSNQGDLVLDPFLGSGTTAVAAKELGRRFIGIEINSDYCMIAEERLRQEILPLAWTG